MGSREHDDSRGQTMTSSQSLGFQQVFLFLSGLFGGDLHAKRILLLANATLGVVRTASLAVNTIGLGLAQARGLVTKHRGKDAARQIAQTFRDPIAWESPARVGFQPF